MAQDPAAIVERSTAAAGQYLQQAVAPAPFPPVAEARIDLRAEVHLGLIS